MAFNSGQSASSGSNYGGGADERHIFLPTGRGERKVHYDVREHSRPADHRKTWVGTFTIVDEDHTVGQLLRHALSADPHVVSAGYLIPHPLENVMRLHLQTEHTYPPPSALANAIDNTLADLLNLARSLDTQLKLTTTPIP